MADEWDDPIERDLMRRLEWLQERRELLLAEEGAVLDATLDRQRARLGIGVGASVEVEKMLMLQAYATEGERLEGIYDEEERVSERLFKLTWQLVRYQKKSPEKRREIQLRLSRRAVPQGPVQ